MPLLGSPDLAKPISWTPDLKKPGTSAVDSMAKPAFWIFELMKPSASGAESKVKVHLLIPPQAVEIHRPIRQQVNQDLGREMDVVFDGYGLVRWNLSGTHGFSPRMIDDKPDAAGKMPGKFVTTAEGSTVSRGLAARNALLDLFDRYVEGNVKLVKSGEPLCWMRLTIAQGGPSEIPWEQWEIVPDEAPRDRRTANQPLAWNWSLGFFGKPLNSTTRNIPLPDWLTATPDTSKAADAKVEEAAVVLTKPSLLQRLGQLYKKVTKFANDLRDGRAALSQALLLGYKDAQGVIDMVLGIIQNSSGVLVDLRTLFRNGRDYVDGAAREARSAVIRGRIAAGELSRAAQRPSESTTRAAYSPSRPISVPVQAGDSLQSIAARILGDASRWQELVVLNNLDHPFLDFSGPGGTPDPALAGRNVLGSGCSIVLPMASTELKAPADPIGWDWDEIGTEARVTSLENLSEALLRRLRTPLGWLPYHPEYGSRLYKAKGQALGAKEVLELRRDVADCLMGDPRVLRVIEVRARADMDSIWIESRVETVLGEIPVTGSVS